MSTSVAELKAVSVWPLYPTVYEINTWIWLEELSKKYRAHVTLASVPKEEWDAVAAYGFDAVWFMGVWERSPMGLEIADRNSGLVDDFRRALPDFQPSDNVGSPYCVRQYVVDRHLGGTHGLATARRELSNRGMRLILDFVPNHVAPDHPWVRESPHYFIQGTPTDRVNDPSSFIEIGGTVFACGRDPYFPAWPDVLQLNGFHPELREAVFETVTEIAEQCDGIRCDMAMLLLNPIFERTWGPRAGSRPSTEYWTDVIRATKHKHPNFLFIAEAYWDLEWELQQQGFDFCYDKKLYDRMEHSTAEEIRLHLRADLAYQSKLVRFIENHDEPRATAMFGTDKQRAFAVTMATLPGLKLFHEGQFEGRKVRPPVFLGRRPDEIRDLDLQIFYARLLQAINRPVFRGGQWALCDRSGWADNSSFHNLIAWCWRQGSERFLIVVNLSGSPAQAQVRIPWENLRNKSWRLEDALSNATYVRDGNEMNSPGLYVDLGPWNYHFFQLLPN